MDTKHPSYFEKISLVRTSTTFTALVSLIFVGCSSSDTEVLPAGDPIVLPTTLLPELPPIGSEGGQVGVFNPTATFDVFACEAPYYLELRGLYTGTVSFTPTGVDVETCTWDTTLQVRGSFENPADTQVCDLDMTYTYTLISGDDSCADGSLDSPLIDPLADPIDRAIWENPPYPQDLPTQLSTSPLTASDTVIPLSTLAADNSEIVWRFDGLGDVVIIDTTEFDGIVSGALFKR